MSYDLRIYTYVIVYQRMISFSRFLTFSIMKLLLYLSSILLFLACQKEDTPSSGEPNGTPTETRLMNDSLKVYFQFNVGTRWIYQRTDTIPPVFDTAWIVNSTQELVFTRFAPYEWERVAVNIEHSYYPSHLTLFHHMSPS